MIKVMIADDQVIVREGLKKILSLDHDIKVVCEASDGREAVDSFDCHAIDVVLMDVRMSKLDGVQAARRIRERHPDTKVIILTTFDEDEYLFKGIASGISGYLLKDSDIDLVIRSVKEAYRGGMVFDPGVAPKLIEAINAKEKSRSPELDCLTDRERQIAGLVAEGHSNQEVAHILFLSEGTVKNAVSRILEKTHLQRRTQLCSLFGRE